MLNHALAKISRLDGIALFGLAKHIWIMFRRAEERRRLSELSLLEWRDLGLHHVRQELSKWPWEQ
jgi:hypothetical protein